MALFWWQDFTRIYTRNLIRSDQFSSTAQKLQLKKERPQKSKHKNQELFILMRSSASSSHKHSDRNSKDSWQCYTNAELLLLTDMTGIQEDLHIEDIDESQKTFMAMLKYIFKYLYNLPNWLLKLATIIWRHAQSQQHSNVFWTLWGEKEILELETGCF